MECLQGCVPSDSELCLKPAIKTQAGCCCLQRNCTSSEPPRICSHGEHPPKTALLHDDLCFLTAQIKSFFISLFIASTGLVMSPVFLAMHLPILTAGLILVVISKTVVVRRHSLQYHSAFDSKSSRLCSLFAVLFEFAAW